jgi:hypothetical protein
MLLLRDRPEAELTRLSLLASCLAQSQGVDSATLTPAEDELEKASWGGDGEG